MRFALEPVQRAIGEALFQRRLYVGAAEAWEHWLELALETDDPVRIIDPLNALTTLYMHRKEPEIALQFADQAAVYLEDGLPPTSEFRTRVGRIGLMHSLGRLDEAMAEAERVRRLLSTGTEPSLACRYWLEVAVNHSRRQEWAPMQAVAAEARRCAQVAVDRAGEARSLLRLGIAHQELGMLEAAERCLTEALTIFASLDPSAGAYVLTELGRLHHARGNLAAALQDGRRALSALLVNMAALDKEEVAKLSSLFGAIFAGSSQRNLALKYHNRAAAYYSQLGLVADWRRATDAVAALLTAPNRPMDPSLQEEAFRLDFLTSVLDLTDDIESVDPFLRGHSERVASLAQMIGRRIRLSEEQLHELSHAARLHDVGKVAVDAEILTKPGKLTEAEFQRVMLHPVIGEEMLKPYGLSPTLLSAIRHHHERWSGGGYPDGIAGEQIPLLARIIAVADTYDAMTSDRFYRSAYTHTEAMAEMQQMAGVHLDPTLVRCFVEMHAVSLS